MSSAFPSATSRAGSMSTRRRTRSRAASTCAVVAPRSPAPMTATVDIRAPALVDSRTTVLYRAMAPLTLTDQTAVVTGGSRGIGYAVAAALLQRGASVVISGTNDATLASAAGRLRDLASSGAQVAAVKADVRRYPEVAHLMETAA